MSLMRLSLEDTPPSLPGTIDDDDEAVLASTGSTGSLKSWKKSTTLNTTDEDTTTPGERAFLAMTGRASTRSRKSTKRSVLESRELHPAMKMSYNEAHIFRVRPWRMRCCFDRESWAADTKSLALALTDSFRFALLTMVLTLCALFADDFRVAVTSKPWDPLFDGITIICIVVFSVEIVAASLAKKDYIGSFFFWLDVFPTATLFLDLTFVADALFCSSVDSGSALKSGRAGRAGARAGRTIRIIRLVRLVKVYKLYAKAVETRDRKRAESRASIITPPPGDFGGHLLDDEGNFDVTATGGSSERPQRYTRPGSTLRDTLANTRQTIMNPRMLGSSIRKTLIGEQKKDPDKETRVGKKLSDMTTRRVIVIVLIMLFGLPWFLPETHGYDEFKSSPSLAIELIFDKWTKWCPGGSHDLPNCLGSDFFTSGGAALSLNQVVSDSIAEARYWYERYLLSFLYLHHDSPFAWKLYWMGFQSKRLNEQLGESRAGERLGMIAQLSQQVFLKNKSLPIAVWDQIFANDNWVHAISKPSASLKSRLASPWTQQCMGSFFGVSIAAESSECALDALRCPEVQYFAPLTRSEDGEKYLQIIFAFDKRTTMKLEAALSMIQTTFICVSIALGAMAFAKDANKMLLTPVASMMAKMETIKDRPMDAMHFGDREYRRQQVLRKERREEYYAGGRCWRCWYRFREKQKFQDPKETVILERTIIKMGNMLALCFGEASGQTIGKYITQDSVDGSDSSGSTVDILVPGDKIDVIFGSCAIRDLMHLSTALDEKVILFINRVSEVLHEIINDFSGNPGKGTGQSFSVAWRLGKDSSINRKMSDMAVVAVVKTIAAVNFCPQLSSYRGQEGLLSQIGQVQIHIEFGLHVGWAIESVIGSDVLIDTAYLSPHQEVTRGLQAATAHYNVPFILSHALVQSCNHAMASRCRLIDQVRFHPRGSPLRIYCVDLDIASLSEQNFQEAATGTRQSVSRSPFRLRQKREISKMQKMAPSVIMNEDFATDPSIHLMRKKYSPEFFKRFFTAYRNYECGEWLVARDMLFTCEYTPSYHTPPVDIHEKDWPMDGPTRALLRFMQSHSYHPPEEWMGFRDFPFSRIESTASMPKDFVSERGAPAELSIEAEKYRLNKLVHIFAHHACHGCACTYIKERTRERFEAKYVIDSSLEHFVVTCDDGVEIVIPISWITDIYNIKRDGEAVLSDRLGDLLSDMSEDDKKKLLVVVYRDFSRDSQLTRVCLLESSEVACDRFLEGIQILSVYAQKVHQNDDVSAFDALT